MKRHLPIWYVLCPALAMLLVLAPILELPPLMFTENFNAFQVLVALPFWIGVAAAPGYLYAWSGAYEPSVASSMTRAWVVGSLAAALLASLGGLITILVVIPFPFVVASVLASFLMMRRFGWGLREPSLAS
jgi:hypothetical protein